MNMLIKYEGVANIFNENIHKSHFWSFSWMPVTLFLNIIYNDKKNERCKTTVCFTTFRHRTVFYRSRANLKSNVKVKLNLAKNR